MFILPIIVAFFASILTFFSGFWIWTILLPVFVLFFPLDLAIAMTWIVHLSNNLFKYFIIWNNFDKNTVLRLWLTWIVWSILWAYIFLRISNLNIDIDYSIFSYSFSVNMFSFIIWALLIFFSFLEISTKFKNINFWTKSTYLVWFLSWLFWWLSWHQWALRTAVLSKLNLSKEVFIWTWVVIAIMVDFTRIWVYFSNFKLLQDVNYLIIFLTILSAFLWSYIWWKLLKKVTIDFVKNIVLALLIVMWTSMMLWII